MTKLCQINEDRLPQKLSVVLSTTIRQEMDAIYVYNQNNTVGLHQWYEYIDGIESYISNRSIAFDYANRFTKFPNGTRFIRDFGWNVGYTIKDGNGAYEPYVYVFMLNLKPEEFGLKVPPKGNYQSQVNNQLTNNIAHNISVDKDGNYVSVNGWGADFVSESRLSNIIRESIDKLLLTEDRGSRSMKSARNYAFQVLGDKQEAIDCVNTVRNELELHNAAEAFVLAGTRMKLSGEYDDTTKDKLTSVIKLISSKYLDQYNNDLNGLSAQELITQHSPEIQTMRDNERNEVSQMEFDGESDYQIVRIDSFEQAQEYGAYTPWCVTNSEKLFDSYTSNGFNQFYFCLKNGFEQVPRKGGEGYPLDDYGLSMFAVRVDGSGDLIGCTTRWNLRGDDYDQNAMSVKQISEVIRMDFYKVFKPNTKLKDAANDAMQRLANGEDPKDVFEYCSEFSEGFRSVKLYDYEKYNFINQNNEIISPDQWFDHCCFFCEGFAIVILNEKYNFIRQNGEIIYKPKEPDEWFDDVNGFREGFAAVMLGDEWNYINQNGEILYEPDDDYYIWFDYCGDFKDGFAEVSLNGESYYIDKNGNLTRERPQPQVGESYLRNVIRESIMNYIKMDMIQ